ncbi:unnamed protein product [Brugia timori]|uniref:Secreted protein n=1 Tax=Brugia timori TaxID=42155 RepID=A0A0R3R4D4_9BILA|nr:unnamed protein product [Brugia timori]
MTVLQYLENLDIALMWTIAQLAVLAFLAAFATAGTEHTYSQAKNAVVTSACTICSHQKTSKNADDSGLVYL